MKLTVAIALLGAAIAPQPREPQSAGEFLARGQEAFRLGENAAALADFDRVVELTPEIEPQLWQRGIAQYYAGAFEACLRQFELHRTVNPDDVENAVWHFLCMARKDGVEAARAALLPVGPDARVPMRQIYQLFEGRMDVETVLDAAKTEGPESRRTLWIFYADLYVGLYLEAVGDLEAARKHLDAAAKAGVGGYMGDVARVHATLLQ